MGFKQLTPAVNEIEPQETRGRPRKLRMQPELTEELCGYLEKGLFLREACALAGVHNESVYSWMRKGVNDQNKELNTPEADFAGAVKRAMAKAEENALEGIRTAGQYPQFWAANAWYLERKFPEKYGKRDRVALEHSGHMAMGVANLDKPLSERLEGDDKIEAAKRIAESLAILGSGSNGSIGGSGIVRSFGDDGEIEDTEPFTIPEWEVD
jgi:transposase